MSGTRGPRMAALILATVLLATAGCTSPMEYIRNGFKVGPNYHPPAAPVEEHWIEQSDVRLRTDSEVPEHWWTLLGDPTLDGLIQCAANQNLSLREAAFRVLEARMQLAITRGNLLPQQQGAFGSYTRMSTHVAQITANAPSLDVTADSPALGLHGPVHLSDLRGPIDLIPNANLLDFGFNLGWELDLWGRLRRAVTAAEDTLDASVNGYDDVLVTMLADIATNYVQVRTLQERIQLVRANVELQRGIWTIARRRFEAGAKNELDVAQAGTNLHQTESQIPQLQVSLRDACNRLCILLGVSPFDLEKRLGESPIPTVRNEILVGIPADLLRRRPDVRRAERLAAAQAEQIGMATALMYPIFSINGTLGWEQYDLPHLFTPLGFKSSFGPGFQWSILNYGRLRANIKLQDAKFRELVTAYQNAVLKASAEAETAITRFLRAQETAGFLDRSVADAQRAADIVAKQYKEGDVDFNRIALIEQTLVEEQDRQAQAHGEIVQGLIQVYRSVGGGWEAPIPPRTLEEIPTPAPPDFSATEELEVPSLSRRN